MIDDGWVSWGNLQLEADAQREVAPDDVRVGRRRIEEAGAAASEAADDRTVIVEQIVDVEEGGDRLLLDLEIIGHSEPGQVIGRNRPIFDKPGCPRKRGAEPVL